MTHAERRTNQKAVASAEKEVQRLEVTVNDLRAALADPALYDGSSTNAKRAGQLDRELSDALKTLDKAMARWADLAGD